MEIFIDAAYYFNEDCCGCDEYDCGCDVKGDCNPNCPEYNPAPDDCWIGA